MNLKMIHKRSSRHLLMFTSEEWDGVQEWQFLFLSLPSEYFILFIIKLSNKEYKRTTHYI